jgi:hypothetical protein
MSRECSIVGFNARLERAVLIRHTMTNTGADFAAAASVTWVTGLALGLMGYLVRLKFLEFRRHHRMRAERERLGLEHRAQNPVARFLQSWAASAQPIQRITGRAPDRSLCLASNRPVSNSWTPEEYTPVSATAEPTIDTVRSRVRTLAPQCSRRVRSGSICPRAKSAAMKSPLPPGWRN